MGLLRDAVRNAANRPTRRERQEAERKQREHQLRGAEESAAVRYYKKQGDTLAKLLDTAYSKIDELNEVLANHKAGDMQDRLINEGLKILPMLFGKQMPEKRAISHTKPTENTREGVLTPPAAATASDKQDISAGAPSRAYSEEEIQQYFKEVPEHLVPKLANLPYDKFSALMKSKLPDATPENILFGHRLVTEATEATTNNEQ